MDVLRLTDTLRAWNKPDFATILQTELAACDPALLPLQAGLRHSSQVHDSPIRVMHISTEADDRQLHVKVGVFYAGIVAGCNCADDPTPVEAQPEYCVLRLDIERGDGLTTATLLTD